jgi:hypothetical protein
LFPSKHVAPHATVLSSPATDAVAVVLHQAKQEGEH